MGRDACSTQGLADPTTVPQLLGITPGWETPRTTIPVAPSLRHSAQSSFKFPTKATHFPEEKAQCQQRVNDGTRIEPRLCVQKLHLQPSSHKAFTISLSSLLWPTWVLTTHALHPQGCRDAQRAAPCLQLQLTLTSKGKERTESCKATRLPHHSFFSKEKQAQFATRVSVQDEKHRLVRPPDPFWQHDNCAAC